MQGCKILSKVSKLLHERSDQPRISLEPYKRGHQCLAERQGKDCRHQRLLQAAHDPQQPGQPVRSRPKRFPGGRGRLSPQGASRGHRHISSRAGHLRFSERLH